MPRLVHGVIGAKPNMHWSRSGVALPGPRGSMVKLRWSQLTQAGTALWVEALGPEASHFEPLDDATLPTDQPYALQGALYSRVTSIYGGSSEIQHDIIARRALGL